MEAVERHAGVRPDHGRVGRRGLGLEDNDEALLRLVTAVLVEIDEKWALDTKAYIKWECQEA